MCTCVHKLFKKKKTEIESKNHEKEKAADKSTTNIENF